MPLARFGSTASRCVDLDTGEIVSDVKDFLNALYEESPERTMDSLTTDYLDVAKVLFFVAKADGQFRREEKHCRLSSPAIAM